MQLSLLHKDVRAPVVVSYGMGVDSTALLVGLAERGERPDLILFADTGAEKRETYEYEPIIQEWLKKVGFPPVTTVRYIAKDFKNFPPYFSLTDNLLSNGTLPGVCFSKASCSLKWKAMPQHAFIKKWEPAALAWGCQLRVQKMIGFDNSPRDRQRTYSARPQDLDRYNYLMPLQRWGWDRERCKAEIENAGLPVPGKSSCFFCLAMKPYEVDQLPEEHLRLIVMIEARAHPRLRNCEGLWRKTVKGMRGATPRPGSMTTYIRERGLLPADEVDRIWANMPTEIVRFQEGFAKAKEEGTLEHFLANGPRDYRTSKWARAA